jgi:protein-S-isoprenylcysteine O-methyltransferase Ste14
MLQVLETWVRRIGVLFGLLAVLTPLLGYRRSRGRPIGRRAGKGTCYLNWSVSMSAALAYVVGGILAWRSLPLSLSEKARWACLILGAATYFPGVGLYAWGYKSLGKQFSPSSSFGARLYSDHSLIQGGPYRIVRHPMYLGVLLAAGGALLLYRTWAMLVYGASVLVVLVRARKEDALLAEEFGDAWEIYRKKVPGWVPRIRQTNDPIDAISAVIGPTQST